MKSWLQDIDREMCFTHNEGYLLFLKNLLEPWKVKYTIIWLQYQKCVHE